MLNIKNKQSRQFVFALIVLGVGIAVMLYMTILLGQRRDWFRMGFFLFFVIDAVGALISMVVDMNIHTCFKRLESIVSSKSDTAQLGFQSLPVPLVIFFIVFIAVMVISSTVAAVEKEWLILCIYLTVFVIGNFIFMGVKISLNIKTYTKHIEELICTGIGSSKKVGTVSDHS